MKILITGGAGFIGSHVADRLVDEGFEVVVVDDLSSGRRENVNKSAKLYELDIKSPHLEKIFEIEKPDYVNHHAAHISVVESVKDPIYSAQNNVIGTINLLENCIKYKVRKLIFASTGGAIYGEQDEFPASENHPARPISPYGITKLTGENYLYYYKACYDLKSVSLRYANIYGPRQDPLGEAGVVAIFIERMLSSKQPVINGDGKQTRDFTYVKDAVDANYLSVINEDSEGIFNIGTGVETNINDIFHILKDFCSSSLLEVHGPAKAGEQKRSVIDPSLAAKILGWNPQTPLREGLKETVDYFKMKKEKKGD